MAHYLNFPTINNITPWNDYSYLQKANAIYLGSAPECDQSLKDKENCELYVDIGSRNLLIVIGESWTWGEGLYAVDHTGKIEAELASNIPNGSSINLRIDYTFSGRMANMLDHNLHIHSVPGNCNNQMVKALERILSNIPSNHYDKIKVVLCLTDPDRDIEHSFDPWPSAKKLFIYNKSNIPVHESLTMDEWAKVYDEEMLAWINSIVDRYKVQHNIDMIVWKNFHNFATTNRNYNFKIIELPYIRWAAKLSGLDDIDLPLIQQPHWWSHCHLFKIINPKPDIDYINIQLDKLENVTKFIRGHPVALSELNKVHPNQTGHFVWAYYLTREAGWLFETY